MGRFLKVALAALGFLLYLWFGAVKNVDLVKDRKRSRHAVDANGSLH